MILNTEFGLIWATHWPDEKQLFVKFSRIRNSRDSQSSVWNPVFSQASYTNNFLALHCHYTGDTQYRVWFDLGNSLTWWKTTVFKILKNSQFAIFAKFRMKNHFFLGKLYQQLFCFTLSLHWWYSIPSLIWFGQLLDPLKKNFFLNSQKFAIREIRKIPFENPTFPRQAIPTTFWLYTVITLVILNTEFGLIWTTPWLDEELF